MTTNERENQIRAHALATSLSVYVWNEFAKSLVEFFNERQFLTPKQINAGESMLKKAKENDWSHSDQPIMVMPLIGQEDSKQEAPTFDPNEEPF